MVEQLVGASNKMAENIVKVTGDTYATPPKPPTPKDLSE